MKILMTFRGGIPGHRSGWYKALLYFGHNVVFWSEEQKPAFDMFDEFKPDILIVDPDHLTKAVFKCLLNSPHIIIVTEPGLYIDDNITDLRIKPEHTYLLATDNQKKNLNRCKDELKNPLFLVSKNMGTDIIGTHSGWNTKGFVVLSCPLAFDSLTYTKATFNKNYECDISYVGGYHPNKMVKLNKIFEIFKEYHKNYNIKIFGDKEWSLPCYCGYINDNNLLDLFVSSKVNLNILHPYAEYDFEINERIFKILGAGRVPVTEVNSAIYDLFESELLIGYDALVSDIDMPLDEKISHSSDLILKEQVHKDFIEKHSYITRMKDLLCQIDK
jgi:hypothetical protein